MGMLNATGRVPGGILVDQFINRNKYCVLVHIELMSNKRQRKKANVDVNIIKAVATEDTRRAHVRLPIAHEEKARIWIGKFEIWKIYNLSNILFCVAQFLQRHQRSRPQRIRTTRPNRQNLPKFELYSCFLAIILVTIKNITHSSVDVLR